MATMELELLFNRITEQLYAFSHLLVGENMASSVVIDSFQALLLEEQELVVEYDGSEFWNEIISQKVIHHCFRIAEARLQDEFAIKAGLFLRHKCHFEIEQIGQVLTLGKNEVLGVLNQGRSQLLSDYDDFDHQLGTCRHTRNIIARFDLGQLSNKDENHLVSCQQCRDAVAEMSRFNKQLATLLEYKAPADSQKNYLATQIHDIIEQFQDLQSANEKNLGGFRLGMREFAQILISKQMIAIYILSIIGIIGVKLLN